MGASVALFRSVALNVSWIACSKPFSPTVHIWAGLTRVRSPKKNQNWAWQGMSCRPEMASHQRNSLSGCSVTDQTEEPFVSQRSSVTNRLYSRSSKAKVIPVCVGNFFYGFAGLWFFHIYDSTQVFKSEHIFIQFKQLLTVMERFSVRAYCCP